MAHKQSIVAILLCAAFIGTYAVTRAAASAPLGTPPALDDVPMMIDGWQGYHAPPLAPDVAEVLAADHYLHRYYVNGNAAVEIDVAYYNQRRVGASMHSPLNCLPGNGWTVSEIRTLTLPTANGHVLVRDLTVRRNKAVFSLAYWYQNRERVLAGEASTRFTLLADSLMRKPADVGLVRVMTPLKEGHEHQHVANFAKALIPELTRSWN